MAPLEDLEQDYPIIDSNFRMFCASHDIFTDEDFLVHDLYALEGFAGQGYAPEKLKQGIKQVFSIMENQHQPWLNGLELLEDARLNKCTLSTGCERIDVLLQGGLRKGHLTELVGPSSSCKTQVCLKSARDRVVEGYFWTVGVYHEPHYDTARKYLTKILAMISIVDDIYDVHGALHDLRRFTHAFPSWDITAFDELPEYMKTYYEALLCVYAEMEDEMGKQGLSYRVPDSKQEMVKLSKAYMECPLFRTNALS